MGFKSEAERKEAAKLLDEEESGPVDNTGIGGVIPPRLRKKQNLLKKLGSPGGRRKAATRSPRHLVSPRRPGAINELKLSSQ